MDAKTWIELYNDAVSEHYSLWNYLWVGAVALIGLTAEVAKNHKQAAGKTVPVLVIAFVGFAVVNAIVIFESQKTKVSYFAHLPTEVQGAAPWSPCLVLTGHIAADVVVVAAAIALAIWGGRSGSDS